ncbi:MAG: hypothetical protein ACI89L_001965 [Phycisphaerales bacterium]|jgi:uncharacterized protein YqjF (DUF2071 family)
MPNRPWAMAMTWRDLLFAHWEVPVEQLRAAVPGGLPLDLYEGRAFIGVVPFRMAGTRARFTPPIPGLSDFPELNVRTYVNVNNKPGVYFFSLDATNRPAIETARATFGLNYLKAEMRCVREGDTVSYSSVRTDRRGPPAEFHARYTATGELFASKPGSLEHWLTERYALYTASKRGGVRMGEIHHRPWPLRPAVCEIETLDMTRLLGLELEGPPVSVLMADSITVPGWLPTRVRTDPAGASQGPER